MMKQLVSLAVRPSTSKEYFPMWRVFPCRTIFAEENVQSVFRRFYTGWLPFSGYEYAGLPDIEVYPIIEGKPTEGHAEVWIAVKKEKEN